MKKFIILSVIISAFFVTDMFAQMELVWENDSIARKPECIVYDESRDCLYVSNFNGNPKNGSNYNSDNVCCINLQGEVINSEMIPNLSAPTGMCINNDKLFVVERFGVVQFDLKSKTVDQRYFIKTMGFLNDVTVDNDGNIYVTESNDSTIYCIQNGKVDKWLLSKDIYRANGILFDNGRLIIGINSVNQLKSIDIKDKNISVIADMGEGIIDGIKKYKDGYFVSHYEGNLYYVDSEGTITELLNTRDKKISCADFEFIESKMLFAIPALKNSSVFLYKYK